MSKTKAPLFSFRAHKSLGKSITFRKHRNRIIAQKHFTPEDKKTADQRSIRTAMKELQGEWSQLTDCQKDSWNNYAREGLRGKIPGYNLFLKHNFIKYHDTGTYDIWANYDLRLILSTGEEIIDSAGNNLVINMGD